MRRRARVGWCPSGKQGAALVHGPEWRPCTSSPRSPCPRLEAPWRVNRRGCLFPVTMCMCVCGRMRVSHIAKCCPLDGTQRPAVPCAANCVQVCSAYWSPFPRSFQNQFSSETRKTGQTSMSAFAVPASPRCRATRTLQRRRRASGLAMPRDGLRPLAQLALLLLPAVTLGVTVENELCPAGAAETMLCSARQDFVLVVDVSYSRQPYFGEFKAFLLAFLDQIGLDGTEDDPRVSVVSFHGSVHANPDEFWTDEESTNYLDLSNSRSEVENFVRNMDDPNAACTETGGCTCISCGANVAWARIPVDSRNGAARLPQPHPPLSTPSPHPLCTSVHGYL